ncbi:hypothetical protein GCM10010136_28690 [Limoniibacter endophyticus]|uniref:Uncharacterized protein n=1 Tax=Limoniibacter endophyticus TaxID=1565040 RepID=A0A8J3DJ77_9HYPH|nr:hypothetical protein GCM10010136_28690 [Limoniibacter endophyticus]
MAVSVCEREAALFWKNMEESRGPGFAGTENHHRDRLEWWSKEAAAVKDLRELPRRLVST